MQDRIHHVALSLLEHLPHPNSINQIGMRGVSGILVFLGTLRPHISSTVVDNAIDAYQLKLEQSLVGNLPVTLYSGISGAALAAYIIDEAKGQLEANERYDEVQKVLVKVLSNNPASMNFDHISGIVGVGAYCHAVSTLPWAKDVLNMAIQCLSERALWDANGCYWQTAVEWLPYERIAEKRPVINLGLAHGVPGVIALLASAERDGFLESEDRILLTAASGWLVSQLASIDGRLTVSSMADDSHEARTAWCYGSPGVAYTLALAGSALKDNKLIQVAYQLLYDGVVGRSLESLGLSELTLCHGYSGVAHMIKRTMTIMEKEGKSCSYLYKIMDSLYLKSLEDLERTLFETESSNNKGKNPKYFDILEGASGVTLALLEVDAVRPRPWEALLLTL